MYLEKIKGPTDIKNLSLDQLAELAVETREFLVQAQARTGGHVGANSGVVELTIALHYTFNSPHDRFIWDVGHQVYVHKMLTGRLNCMETMRQNGGSPGFPARAESEHDPLDTSHGGTSLSVTLGIALANRLSGSPNLPIAIIGDCALGEGMAFEALNEIGYEKPRMLIVLNDNGWGITSNETALSTLGKGSNVPETFFTSLGLEYIGPVNGHDIRALVQTMAGLKDINGAVVLHVKTIKGYGLPYANKSITRFHFSFPFNIQTGEPILEGNGKEENIFYKPRSPFNAELIGKKIEEIAVNDPEVVIITPGTIGVAEAFGAFQKVPKRAFNVGMAEQHAIGLAVGFSLQGKKPIVIYQSTFFQRAFDQLIHDAGANDIPMIIILGRSGLAGLDHSTHHAIFDLSYLSCVPNIEIYFPPGHQAFNDMLESKVKNWVRHPVILLFPYGTLEMVEPSEDELSLLVEDPFALKNAGIILTTAGRLKSALVIKRMLRAQGVEWAVINVTQLKPLDEALFTRIMQRYERVVTMEENVARGGLGSMVLEFAADHCYKPDLIRVTLGDRYVEHGMRPYLYKKYSIDESSIIARMGRRWPDLMKVCEGCGRPR